MKPSHRDTAQVARYPHTILATCCVPWDKRGELEEDVFRASVRTLLGHGLRDLYVFGTAGEGHAVDERRFDEVVGAFADELRTASAPPMVGIISLSLATVVERVERCAARGVECFQLSLPSWGALSDRELNVFFAETCGRFPQLRFLHYNLPRARRTLTPDEYSRLAQRHPNLVATKNAGADHATIAALLERAPELRHFFTEPGYGHAAGLGPAGLLISVAMLNPALARAYFEAGRDGDRVTLDRLARELADLTSILLQAVGSGRMDGAYDKCLSRIHEPTFPLRLLAPYTGADEADWHYGRFVAAVRERHPQWIGA